MSCDERPPSRSGAGGRRLQSRLTRTIELRAALRHAPPQRIQLRRPAKDGSETVYNYNYDSILAGGSGGTTRLQDGDVIIIPQRRLFE